MKAKTWLKSMVIAGFFAFGAWAWSLDVRSIFDPPPGDPSGECAMVFSGCTTGSCEGAGIVWANNCNIGCGESSRVIFVAYCDFGMI